MIVLPVVMTNFDCPNRCGSCGLELAIQSIDSSHLQEAEEVLSRTTQIKTRYFSELSVKRVATKRAKIRKHDV